MVPNLQNSLICLFSFPDLFKEKIHVVQKEIAKPRLLPPPPKPVTKLVSVSENNG